MDAYVDCSDIIGVDFLSDEVNQVVYRCADDYYSEGQDLKLDITSLYSVAKKLGLDHVISGPDEKRHIRSLYSFPVELSTVRSEARKLFKLRTALDWDLELAKVRRKLHNITGSESLSELIAIVEEPVFDMTARLNGEQDGPVQIAHGGREWLENIIANPCDNIGIPSPFPKYNHVIGGGWRRKTVSMLAARPKTGKTMWADNVCMHVAGTLGIPVFNLDTEMTQDEHLARILAFLTGIKIRRIETGKVTKEEADILREKMIWLETIPYYYESVIDKTFEEQVASMRRWVVKRVGFDEKGRTKDCLVVYDYLQMTDPGDFKGDFKEYQMLGFQMLALLRMAKRCDVPILSLLQTNREGITKETTAVAAGSDRIIWKCANFAILKRKEAAEIAVDGDEEGNRKVYIPIARHGEEMAEGDYISVKFDGGSAKMVEGRTRSEIHQNTPSDLNKGFSVEYNESNQQSGDGGNQEGGRKVRRRSKQHEAVRDEDAETGHAVSERTVSNASPTPTRAIRRVRNPAA